jgi:hypothetical protein
MELDFTQYSTPELLKLYRSIQQELLERSATLPAAGVKIEAANYQKAQAALAAKGYADFQWVDENGGADFTAQRPTGRVRIQLKPRVGFWRQYVGNDILICAVTSDDIYLYPHDQMLEKYAPRFQHCRSWEHNGVQYWPPGREPAWVREWLAPFLLTKIAYLR